jgi:hypothetical protein
MVKGNDGKKESWSMNKIATGKDLDTEEMTLLK